MLTANSGDVLYMLENHNMKRADIINLLKYKNRTGNILTALFENGVDIIDPSLNLHSCSLMKVAEKHPGNQGEFYSCKIKSDKITVYFHNQTHNTYYRAKGLTIVSY